MDYYMHPVNLNVELVAKECGAPVAPEKDCLKQAQKAEMAFRISKGYEKDNFWTRVKYFFKEK